VLATSPLERALAYAGGSHTLADIHAAVACGQLQRWDGERSTIVTEIRETPQQRILLFFLAEGDLTELRGMARGIEDWGRALGCHKAQLVGRRGWERSAIVQDGWKLASIVMEKEL
jgi:hypothetical protein